MNTTVWLNTVDNTPPTGRATILPSTEGPNFTVQWSGTDVGSGIASFTVYVSDNGGPFTALETNTTATSAIFTGSFGHTGVYSIARDLVGNVEGAKTAAEATTTVSAVVVPPPTVAAQLGFPNGATAAATDSTLNWTASPGVTSYDVYLGTSNPPPFVANVISTSYTLHR